MASMKPLQSPILTDYTDQIRNKIKYKNVDTQISRQAEQLHFQ